MVSQHGVRRRAVWPTVVVVVSLIAGWAISTALYVQTRRYGVVVEATSAISTSTFEVLRSMSTALAGSQVSQRKIEGAMTVMASSLATLESSNWDAKEVRWMQNLHQAVLMTGAHLAEADAEERREFLLNTQRVCLGRLITASTTALRWATNRRSRAIGYLYGFLSATFLIALGAVSVAIVSLFRQYRERDRYERTLREANEHLRAHANEMEQIVYITSHDLKEPLRMVHSYVDILHRTLAPSLTDANRRYFDHVRKGAIHMQALIDDLLHLAVLGRDTHAGEEFDATEEIETVVSFFRPRLAELGADVVVDQMPRLSVDRTRFAQLVQNLLANAIKYHDSNRPLRIQIACQADGKAWRFTVADNGIGIPEEHHEQIFKLFRRLHGPEIEGTGAGLAICRKIAEGWNGRLTVASWPGKGSTFTFTVPIETSAE